MNRISWREALERYRYPVDLRVFGSRTGRAPAWFDLFLSPGDRSQTVEFENRFRVHAPAHIEAWHEVVYWKMASQKGRATLLTGRLINENRSSASELWARCDEFVASGTRQAFERFQKLLFKSQALAVAFTFPAFAAPALYPMADTRIARYLAFDGPSVGFEACTHAARTLRRYRESSTPGALTLRDWPFVEQWVEWCRGTAVDLSKSGSMAWRPRDVEMAVFRAWGEKGERQHSAAGPRYRLPKPGRNDESSEPAMAIQKRFRA